MSDKVKLALIAAATVIAVVGMVIYFSPYQSCVRAMTGDGGNADTAHVYCNK